MTKPEKQTAPAEVLQDQGRGDESEENLPLFPTPAPEPAQEDFYESVEIDWENDPAVILRDQAAVAAFFNKFGELVVKQRDSLGCEAVLFVAPENVVRFLDGLDVRARPRKKAVE